MKTSILVIMAVFTLGLASVPAYAGCEGTSDAKQKVLPADSSGSKASDSSKADSASDKK
ncbi:MAG: hypothetical protein AABZ55_01730 [Bdellovibrionota bacterium]